MLGGDGDVWGAHHWGREIQQLGHEERLIAPFYVKAFAKRQKSDARDAAAIVEAAQRPTMRFVAVKTQHVNELAALNVVAAAGVPTEPARHAQSASEAGDAAADLGFPVVLKVLSADILHKSDIGGVRPGVADRAAAKTAFDEILTACPTAQPDAMIDGCLLAPMVTGGVETILVMQCDPIFGPIVLFGLGGIFVEAPEDVTLRAAPSDEAKTQAMIESVAAHPHLTGLRG